MDGPCHLYNSNIINNLIKFNSSVINDFFVLNKEILPNWTSYFVLALFNIFLPAWVAEKILLIFYLLGIAISFRLLIKQLCPENANLSIFIIPFAYSFLFHVGFYNYCLSFIFLFLTLYYWLRNYEVKKAFKYVFLFILITLTYLSALLTFFFLGFCLGLFTIAFSIKDYYNRSNHSSIIKRLIIELVTLLIITLPYLVLSAFFIKSRTFFSSSEHFTTGELIKWLNDVRCIIVYDYADEEKLTKHFLHIAIAVLSISFFIRFYKKGCLFDMYKARKSDIMIIPILLALLLFFIVPNGYNAGMMSDRYCLLVYMFFIIWVSSQPLPQMVSKVFIILIIVFQVGLLFKRQNGTIIGLNKDATAIYNASEYIEANSIVLPVNMSDNWIEPHFSNYLGVDKPLIILENYEASLGWFPVKWNTRQMPRLKLGEFDAISGVHWLSNSESTQVKQIDYVFLYGNTKKINDPDWSELKSIINKSFKLVFSSSDNYIAIYKMSIANINPERIKHDW
jgi:hypothetical protein